MSISWNVVTIELDPQCDTGADAAAKLLRAGAHDVGLSESGSLVCGWPSPADRQRARDAVRLADAGFSGPEIQRTLSAVASMEAAQPGRDTIRALCKLRLRGASASDPPAAYMTPEIRQAAERARCALMSMKPELGRRQG